MYKFLKKVLPNVWTILTATFMSFSEDNGLKLSASLAYYTIFSIAPLLILIISLAGLFLGPMAASNSLFQHISGYVGVEAAKQIQEIIKNLHLSGKSGFTVIIGIIILFVGASSIFIEIQDSLNIIWRVKAKPKRGWLKLIQNRFLSFSLIISLGFLLLSSLLINLVLSALSNRVERFFPSVTHFLVDSINIGITVIVITVLFAIIFKFLPDVKIKWRDVWIGALFTALLFMVGQFVINYYIRYTAQKSVYGAAGSILLILVWVYYTSVILYIGAEFTQVYVEASGRKIKPADYAVYIQITEVENVVDTLPPQNPELKKIN